MIQAIYSKCQKENLYVDEQNVPTDRMLTY